MVSLLFFSFAFVGCDLDGEDPIVDDDPIVEDDGWATSIDVRDFTTEEQTLIDSAEWLVGSEGPIAGDADAQAAVLAQVKHGIEIAILAGFDPGTISQNVHEWLTADVQIYTANWAGGDGAADETWGVTGISLASPDYEVAGFVAANEIINEWTRLVGLGGVGVGAALTPPVFGGTVSFDDTLGHAVITGGVIDYTASKDGVVQVFERGIITIDADDPNGRGAAWTDNATLAAE